MVSQIIGDRRGRLAHGYSRIIVWTTVLTLFCVFCCRGVPESSNAASAQKEAPQGKSVDAFMGDWQGRWVVSDGSDTGPLVAQVIALGKGEYQANILDEFDSRARPIAVLVGMLENGTVSFSGQATYEGMDFEVHCTIAGGKFMGNFEGSDASGSFTMDRVVRLSPTLGAKAPAGAVVLFDGRDFGQWERLVPFAGMINIAEVVGSEENAAAYLQARLWSDSDQQVGLELGSDDGVKVWLNGQVVHTNNASRAVAAGQDKFKVGVKRGWNDLMLKITNGGGGWAACARVVGADGKKATGVAEEEPRTQKATRMYLDLNNDFATIWRIAGPYRQEGKSGRQLLDVAFSPESPGGQQPVKWKRIGAAEAEPKKVQWLVVDDAMEVKPGGGSIVTKRKFDDFKMHIEFCTPFMPEARGQGRGNSGVYLQGRYEVQVLDSYGLEGRDNECGGIYQIGEPIVNMCAPPMQWQTYDIIFRAARFDDKGKKIKDPEVTIKHNDVEIHTETKLPRVTGGALDSNEAEPGGVYLQDHGNRVRYRNIWLVELKRDEAG
ncbi:MAG: DUF1080 domain-containing protein [Phycisphaerales bacterium]|nr:MAG: DUF1080 domain-containing protein [Phycisphaerales bacterium]